MVAPTLCTDLLLYVISTVADTHTLCQLALTSSFLLPIAQKRIYRSITLSVTPCFKTRFRRLERTLQRRRELGSEVIDFEMYNGVSDLPPLIIPLVRILVLLPQLQSLRCDDTYNLYLVGPLPHYPFRLKRLQFDADTIGTLDGLLSTQSGIQTVELGSFALYQPFDLKPHALPSVTCLKVPYISPLNALVGHRNITHLWVDGSTRRRFDPPQFPVHSELPGDLAEWAHRLIGTVRSLSIPSMFVDIRPYFRSPFISLDCLELRREYGLSCVAGQFVGIYHVLSDDRIAAGLRASGMKCLRLEWDVSQQQDLVDFVFRTLPSLQCIDSWISGSAYCRTCASGKSYMIEWSCPTGEEWKHDWEKDVHALTRNISSTIW